MNKIKVVVSYFGETEQLEFLTEDAFEAFKSGWELGALFTDENGGYERVPSDVIRGKEKEKGSSIPKFRVWNSKSAKMWPVDKLIWDDRGQCHPVSGESFLVYSDRDVLMQWISLLDVDGVEIFEGDIVQFTHSKAIEKVICDSPCFKTPIRSPRGCDCKIIGNIFENSNILETVK